MTPEEFMQSLYGDATMVPRQDMLAAVVLMDWGTERLRIEQGKVSALSDLVSKALDQLVTAYLTEERSKT